MLFGEIFHINIKQIWNALIDWCNVTKPMFRLLNCQTVIVTDSEFVWHVLLIRWLFLQTSEHQVFLWSKKDVHKCDGVNKANICLILALESVKSGSLGCRIFTRSKHLKLDKLIQFPASPTGIFTGATSV